MHPKNSGNLPKKMREICKCAFAKKRSKEVAFGAKYQKSYKTKPYN